MLVSLVLLLLVSGGILGRAKDDCNRRNIAFVIDESGSVTVSGFQKQLSFLQNVASTFSIGEEDTLVGAVAFSNTARLVFGFQEHTTTSDVVEALGNIDYRKGGTAIGAGIDFARENLFTTQNGYRENAANHIILITDGNSYDTADAGKRARNVGFTITAVGVDDYNYDDLIQATGSPSRIFLAPNLDALGSLTDNVTKLFFCGRFGNCGDKRFGYSGSFSETGQKAIKEDQGFLLADYQVTCCGVITSWEFVPAMAGKMQFHIWRKESHTYRLIAISDVVVYESDLGGSKNFSVSAEQHVAVEDGDIIGWYSPGAVIPAYVSSFTGKTLNRQSGNFSLLKLEVGSTFDWSNETNTTSVDGRTYMFRFYTDNYTAPVYTKKTSFLLPDHTPVGATVTDFVVDYLLTVRNLTMNHTYFCFNENQDKIVVKSKLPRMYAEYELVVTSVNACYMTSSVTLTVTTYNMPPKLTNIPVSVTIGDDTRTEVKLRDLDIIDGSGDPLCCMLSRIQPVSSNFKIIFNETNRGYSVYTVVNPTFNNKEISNFYRLTICCTDGMVTSSNFMDVKVLATSKLDVYVPPAWFMSAIAVGLIPVSIALIFTCIFICDTMYFNTEDVNERQKRKRKAKKKKHLSSPC